MSLSSAEIEAVIRVVLDRLRAESTASFTGGGPATTATTRGPAPAAGQAAVASTTSLRLADRLITLERIQGRLEGIQIVEVPARSVVTPAVRDELRDRGIQLSRLAPAAAGQNSGAAPPMLIAAPPAKCKTLNARRTRLQSTQAELGSTADTANSIVQWLRSQAEPAALAIWSSPLPFAAALACKPLAELQAVQVSSLADIPRVVQQASPNLLLLDDSDWTAAAVLNLASTWLRSRP